MIAAMATSVVLVVIAVRSGVAFCQECIGVATASTMPHTDECSYSTTS